jgi:curved DNA-binding protein CbpA
MRFYAILGIPSDADQETIRGSYRALARRYHPDRGAGASPEKFRLVVEAYQTLSDPHRRAMYDRSLQRPQHSFEITVEPLVPHARGRSGDRRSGLRARSRSIAVASADIHTWTNLFDELMDSLSEPFFFGRPWTW